MMILIQFVFNGESTGTKFYQFYNVTLIYTIYNKYFVFNPKFYHNTGNYF